MTKVAIYGCGDLGLQFYSLLQASNTQCAGFLDDTKEIGYKLNLPLPVIGNKGNVKTLHSNLVFDSILIAIGYNNMYKRNELYDELKSIGVQFFTLIHPTCIVDTTSKINEGSVLYPGSIIDMNVVIDENVVVNNGCIISHDSIIGKSSYLSPGVVVSGFSKIGKSNFIGSGSVVSDNVITTDNIKIGAGSLVLSNLNEKGLYFGSPAKFIKNV